MKQQKIKFIYADLMRNADEKDEIYLDTYGTEIDLKRHDISFIEGERYWFWRDDEENNPFIFSAKVRFDKVNKKWIAKIDPESLKHLNESEFAGKYDFKEIKGPDLTGN